MNSKRLDSLLSVLPCGVSLADIGSDHGFLAVEAVRQRGCRAVASDIAAGPLRQTQRLAARSGVALDVRRGDGLQPLRPGEVHTVVLAGMGSQTIVRILRQAGPKAATFPHWIFQPMNRPEILRHWLDRMGMAVSHEWIVVEGRRYYVCMQAGWSVTPDDSRLLRYYPGLSQERIIGLGPKLLLNPARSVQMYFAYRLQCLQNYVASLPLGPTPMRQQVQDDIRIWKQVMSCHSQFSE